MRDKKELEKALRYFRHKVEYTVESDERKEMYVIAVEAVEKVLNPDFVEVVRCKDCRHYGGVTFGRTCRMYSGTYTRVEMPEDGFCCWGERREEG